jgi:hypothetical protein
MMVLAPMTTDDKECVATTGALSRQNVIIDGIANRNRRRRSGRETRRRAANSIRLDDDIDGLIYRYGAQLVLPTDPSEQVTISFCVSCRFGSSLPHGDQRDGLVLGHRAYVYKRNHSFIPSHYGRVVSSASLSLSLSLSRPGG